MAAEEQGSRDEQPDAQRPDAAGSGVGEPSERASDQLQEDTAAQAPLEDTAAQAPLEETAGQHPDQTRMMPADLWSGRAEVPRAYTRPGAPPVESWEDEDEPAGHWWMPIVVGLVALVLLGMLGTGIWLILRSGGSGPAVAPTASTVSMSASSSASLSPTPSEAVTSEAATPAGQVVVPPIRGMSEPDATAALTRLGLRVKATYVATGDQPPGTVIFSSPAEGTSVDAGSTVTLTVAKAPETPSPTPSSSPGAATPTTGTSG